MIDVVIYNAIRKMSEEQRAYWKSKFTKDQWLFMCKGMPW